VDYPYAAYGDLQIEPILPDRLTGEIRGDVYDRIVVRLLEIPQSIDIIEQCLAAMPEGPIIWEPKLAKLLLTLKKAKGEAVGRHEAPRGEVLHYIRMDGKEAPTTWKVKASSYSNLMAWIPMLRGEQIADIPSSWLPLTRASPARTGWPSSGHKPVHPDQGRPPPPLGGEDPEAAAMTLALSLG